MTRRTALQFLGALLAGYQGQASQSGAYTFTKLPKPPPLTLYLNWKSIRVERNGQSVEVDQDELFAALQKAPGAGGRQ